MAGLYEQYQHELMYDGENLHIKQEEVKLLPGVYEIYEDKDGIIRTIPSPNFSYNLPEKIYGNTESKLKDMIVIREKLGVITSMHVGVKGMGKTVIAMLLLKHYAATEPVFYIDSKIKNGSAFKRIFKALEGRFIFIDEYDNNMSREAQEGVVSMFGKTSMIITLNNKDSVIDEFIDRRIEDYAVYNIVPEDAATEAIEDLLGPEGATEDDMVELKKTLLSIISKDSNVTMANITTTIKYINLFWPRKTVAEIVNSLNVSLKVGNRYVIDNFESNNIKLVDGSVKDEGYGTLNINLKYVVGEQEGLLSTTLWSDNVVESSMDSKTYVTNFWSSIINESVQFKITIKEISGMK